MVMIRNARGLMELTDVAEIKAKTDLLPVSPASEVSAAAAVIQAQIAALAAQATLDTLLLYNESTPALFPSSTERTVRLTAGTPLDTFCAWTEIADDTAATLSTLFAVHDGYLREITLYGYSKTEEIYIIELGYGANAGAVTMICPILVRSDWTYVLTLFGKKISAGSKIWYRMKAHTALAYMNANLKYYLKP